MAYPLPQQWKEGCNNVPALVFQRLLRIVNDGFLQAHVGSMAGLPKGVTETLLLTVKQTTDALHDMLKRNYTQNMRQYAA
eukprot:1120785-Rhodomonas_salina.3